MEEMNEENVFRKIQDNNALEQSGELEITDLLVTNM